MNLWSNFWSKIPLRERSLTDLACSILRKYIYLEERDLSPGGGCSSSFAYGRLPCLNSLKASKSEQTKACIFSKE